ncbi:DNA-processing protein DprA [Paraburkholderia aspalathi]|uniref:DNA-processing protein DprA n=1 Tax=Paraburkholderia aspalathi TaxID=1324617 RepID=UPI0038BC7A29
MAFETSDSIFAAPPIDPIREMAAYEALWTLDDASFKSLAQTFEKNPGATPSELIPAHLVDEAGISLTQQLDQARIDDWGICLYQTADYPKRLRDAEYPVEFFYYRGALDLAFSPRSIAVVGTREPSPEGVARTRRLVRLLVEEKVTIFSGLARGIDTIAHKTAIDCGGKTVAVIGTPITETYPKENLALQETIARKHLLISQVPILRYSRQTFRGNRLFFPERNATMSALADATIIVEAGETSGTLIQARAALKQKRKLFILDSCFTNPSLTWPAKYEERGAIRVKDFDDILSHLDASTSADRRPT